MITVSLLMLLTVLALGMLGLASIELRRAGHGVHEVRAKANARLALMMALGELQRQAGPDTRATANASILGESGVANPHWTGIWSTRSKDGGRIDQRDDAVGGLRDVRGASWDRETESLGWLVSGTETAQLSPRAALSAGAVELLGPGTVGRAAAGERVSAPRVRVQSTADGSGGYAWWVGDLGVKANVATPDAFEARTPNPSNPADGGWFRLMTSQEADASDLASGPIDAPVKRRLASERTAGLLDRDAAAAGFHDFTTFSEGVLADMAEGGLKRDLTAFIESDGSIPDFKGSPGLADEDRLVGPANAGAAARQGVSWTATRHRNTSPRFGLLRRWAQAEADFNGKSVPAVLPKLEARPKVGIGEALSNNRPIALSSMDTPSLSPILVEGSMFYNMTWHRTTPGRGGNPYQVRLHVYPRVVLWNPYNVELDMEPLIGMIQGNGRQEMWTDGYIPSGNNRINVMAQWIWFEGGRNSNFVPADGSILNSQGYTDPYMGCFYFSIPRTRFGPGECLVFSAERSGEYNRPMTPTSNNFALEANTLTCEKPPHPSRSYYMSDSEIGGGITFIPTYYWFAPTTHWTRAMGRNGIENQGDDSRVILKKLGTQTGVTFEDFDSLPQVAVLSASLQYGGGREPRISWNINEKMVVEETATFGPVSTVIPNVRTREGIRLRWFDEHRSNEVNSGGLNGSPHFQEALLGNWNPRATFMMRSPYENIAGTLPVVGSGGGPWFFGAYTRDLYDDAVSWEQQMPVARGGRYHGNPFGPPQESGGRPIVLFDVPRSGTGVLSIGQFQHAKLSEFVWHPSYAVGQSLPDPRVGALDRTAPTLATAAAAGGFDAPSIGWSDDGQRSVGGRDAWARQARAMLLDVPTTDNLVYDLSYEVNRNLWDGFFLSTGSPSDKRRFLGDPGSNPLPNGRIRLAPRSGAAPEARDLTDLHQAARHLTVDGAFNVNSTSVAAWVAMLRSTLRLSPDGKTAAFPRVLAPPQGAWLTGDSVESAAAWAGYRALTLDETERLARAVVEQVRLRGPFLSLADFVNRRLANDETGRAGALQAAIDAAGLNRSFRDALPLDNRTPLKDYRHPDNIRDATRLDQTLKPDSKAWGLPAFLTQGDVLQVLGPALNARSDTFMIRTYGDSADASGKVQARAWCEAVVQRCPEPVTPDDSGLNPARSGGKDFGRRFIVKSFRWLKPDEV